MATRIRTTAPTWLGAAFVALVLRPHLDRLAHPSLYADDVVRVAQLRTTPLGDMLFQPFNEHVAPLFQAVSWATWRLAGRGLTRAPSAFTLASFLPFALALPALGLLVRRESGSPAAALAAVAAFGLSWLHVEAAWWYSASSFTWALLATLAALLAVAADRPILTALATLAAPAFSAIGLLAGPLAALRALAESGRATRRRALAAGLAVAGSLLYLAICSLFRYGDVLSDSLRRRTDWGAGLLAVARAPGEVLLPALFGLKATAARIPPAVSLPLFGAGAIAALAWARRSPRRPAILVGLGLVVGGYGMIYPFRAVENPSALLMVQRYHLFPMAGLVLLLATWSAPRLRRLDASPTARLAFAVAAAALLLATHRTELAGRCRFLRFPEQARTLAALERLADVGRRAGITRGQALAALEPIRPRWFDFGLLNPLEMLGPAAEAPRLPDSLVRPTLLAALRPDDREALWGGMDATPYLRPAAGLAAEPTAVGRLVASSRVRAEGPAGHYVTAGWPAYLEFEISNPKSQLPEAAGRLLSLPATAPGGLELWWADAPGRWAETRRVLWHPDPAVPTADWSVPLDRLPHWDPARARRLRVFFKTPGPVAVGEPRLLR